MFQPELLLRGLGGGLRGRTLRAARARGGVNGVGRLGPGRGTGERYLSSSNLAAMFDGHFVSVGV